MTSENSCVELRLSESLSRISRFVAPPARAHRRLFGFLCLIALASRISTPLHAQQGFPIVQKSGTVGDNTPSPIVVDAKQYLSGASGDACKAIQNAITQMQTQGNGVVDARGITGDQSCAVNMFGTTTAPTGKLLLGNVVIHASTTQVQPTLFQVEGTGWAIEDNVSTP